MRSILSLSLCLSASVSLWLQSSTSQLRRLEGAALLLLDRASQGGWLRQPIHRQLRSKSPCNGKHDALKLPNLSQSAIQHQQQHRWPRKVPPSLRRPRQQLALDDPASHTTGRKGPGSPVTFCSRPPYAQHEHPAQPQPSDVVPAPRTSAPKRLPLQQCDHPTQDDSRRITSPGTTQWLRHGRKAA